MAVTRTHNSLFNMAHKNYIISTTEILYGFKNGFIHKTSVLKVLLYIFKVEVNEGEKKKRKEKGGEGKRLLG